MEKKWKRILIFIRLLKPYNLRLLEHILEYVSTETNWICTVKHGNPESLSKKELQETDGILAISALSTQAALRRRSHKPCVDIWDSSDLPPVFSVGNDNREIGRTAARHFMETKVLNFAFTGFNEGYSQDRLAGYKDELRYSGLADPQVFIVKDDSQLSLRAFGFKLFLLNRDQLKSWLKSLPKPVGVFCANDSIAEQVVELCRDTAIAVPEDLLVLGVDNYKSICTSAPVPISSIGVPFQNLAAKSVDLLELMMNGGQPDRKRILIAPPEVSVRRSTDIVASDDRQVSTALRFIRENFQKPIGINDVVAVSGICRTLLQKRFCLSINSTILKEIHHARVRQARRLLMETDFPVEQIATLCGFGDSRSMRVVFNQTTGHPPTHFRKA